MSRAKTIRHLRSDRTHGRKGAPRRHQSHASRKFEQRLNQRFHEHEKEVREHEETQDETAATEDQ
jgi:hypothetical protein